VGQQLLKCYEFAKANGGVQLCMRLAMKTGIPESKAGSEPDTPDNVGKFKAAIKEFTGKDAPV